MKRKDALAAIKVAAYHDDAREIVRLYTENRISQSARDEAVKSGIQARANGMKCACYLCKQAESKGAA